MPGDGPVSLTAGVAQLVEHLICNQRVRGSNPFASSSIDQQDRFRNAGHCARRGGITSFPTALHKEAFPNEVCAYVRVGVRIQCCHFVSSASA